MTIKTRLISNDLTTTLNASLGSSLYVIDTNTDILVGSGNGISATTGATSRSIVVKGHVSSTNAMGIEIGDPQNDGAGVLAIASTGSVNGAIGIYSHADGEIIKNAGQISGTVDGILMSGDHSTIANSSGINGDAVGIAMIGPAGGLISNTGTISSAQRAVYAALNPNEVLKIVNDGSITSNQLGIDVNNGIGAKTVIVNHGEISGTFAAINTGNADTREIVINSGTITGNVLLGAGNDTYDGRGGTATEVFGGTGNDIYIISDTATAISESSSQGTDTVKASVNWTLGINFENLTLFGTDSIIGKGNDVNNVIKGNAGSNLLFGFDGSDILNGGLGNDMLSGGAMGDTFVFSSKSGQDTIADFQNGLDIIDLRGIAGLDSFAEIMAAAHQVGNNVVIDFGSDELTLNLTSLANLSQDDFMF